MKFRVRIWRETMANARKREKGRGTEQVGGWDPVLSVEERRRGWKRREQTGPMCVCSAENNVHTEALMRFKNNGDYLHYSLGITRTAGDALAFAPRLASRRVAVSRHSTNQPGPTGNSALFGPPSSTRASARYANANPAYTQKRIQRRRITRGKTMPWKKTHYTAITI